MNLNFKKNNLLIIMLLIFVILSCIIFVNMSNVKEAFGNIDSRKYFLDNSIDSSYNYYTLDTRRYKYKLATLPTGLILESSSNLTSINTALRSRNLDNFRAKKILISYYKIK